jgi:flavin reductase (DIM6/NTAB) family NADH-FMN oxidoreductase RutF
MGIAFYEAKKRKVPMITGAAMNAECKLIKQGEEQLGDHIMFVGEVVEIHRKF